MLCPIMGQKPRVGISNFLILNGGKGFALASAGARAKEKNGRAGGHGFSEAAMARGVRWNSRDPAMEPGLAVD